MSFHSSGVSVSAYHLYQAPLRVLLEVMIALVTAMVEAAPRVNRFLQVHNS
jgi:hypothetical protein